MKSNNRHLYLCERHISLNGDCPDKLQNQLIQDCSFFSNALARLSHHFQFPAATENDQ